MAEVQRRGPISARSTLDRADGPDHPGPEEIAEE
jgi:hypothetical protein